jgi:zinc/manganese transport system substrate-binding protein
MNKRSIFAYLTLAALIPITLSPGLGQPAAGLTTDTKTIVATYAVLGSIAEDLVGDACRVRVMIPNGLDPHEWEPSARDVAAMMKADMIVQNGLELESGLQDSLAQAKQAGIKFLTAADHIKLRWVGPGEGLATGDPDQALGAKDPHLWMDPVDMKRVVAAMAEQFKTDLGIDLSVRAVGVEKRLDQLNDDAAALCASIFQADRASGRSAAAVAVRRPDAASLPCPGFMPAG